MVSICQNINIYIYIKKQGSPCSLQLTYWLHGNNRVINRGPTVSDFENSCPKTKHFPPNSSSEAAQWPTDQTGVLLNSIVRIVKKDLLEMTSTT